ncbi:hypothetical protein D3C79_1017690 [compost metagenome]
MDVPESPDDTEHGCRETKEYRHNHEGGRGHRVLDPTIPQSPGDQSCSRSPGKGHP